MTFLAEGRQLIVVPVGGKGYGTGWIAFGLPVSANEPGVYSAAQAKHGEQLYSTHCAACHGATLGGSEHSPGLEGGSFWGQWDGETVRHLYSRIISTMPPTAPGSLERTDVIDIVTYILQSNGLPAGEKAIGDPNQLNALKLQGPKRPAGSQEEE
jgi:mono/diheme cytochrome c family protein